MCVCVGIYMMSVWCKARLFSLQNSVCSSVDHSFNFQALVCGIF